MKKLLFCALFAFLSISCFAQLNVTKANTKIEKIGTLRSAYAWMYCQGTDYYLYIRTSNQFDDPTLFCLGETAETSIQTAKDMIAAIDNIEYNASLEVSDAKGIGALLVKKKIVGSPYWDILQESRAGTSNITPKELQTAIKIITEHSGIALSNESNTQPENDED